MFRRIVGVGDRGDARQVFRDPGGEEGMVTVRMTCKMQVLVKIQILHSDSKNVSDPPPCVDLSTARAATQQTVGQGRLKPTGQS